VLSPLLGNIYLHYALDVWFETTVKPRLAGQALAGDVPLAVELQMAATRPIYAA
jgi:hypothetical protein